MVIQVWDTWLYQVNIFVETHFLRIMFSVLEHYVFL